MLLGGKQSGLAGILGLDIVIFVNYTSVPAQLPITFFNIKIGGKLCSHVMPH